MRGLLAQPAVLAAPTCGYSRNREHGRGTTGSSSMPGFTAPGAALLRQQANRVISFRLRTSRTGGAHDSHHRTAGIAGRTRRRAAWPFAARARSRPSGCGAAESEEKREPVSDIDTGVVDSPKALDPDGRLEK